MLVMIEGERLIMKTSAPRLPSTLLATKSFKPLTRLTTAITDVTPMTTPSSVSTLRILCAHRLAVAIRTASPSVMEVLPEMGSLGAMGVFRDALRARVLIHYTRRERPKLHPASVQMRGSG